MTTAISTQVLATPVKVCIMAISLGKGGAERSTSLLSLMLKEKGLDVHVVTLNDVVDYEFGGQILNLGKQKPKKDTILKRLKRFSFLRNYLVENQFDFIIDNRVRNTSFKELYYLNYIYKGFKIIYVVRSFIPYSYFPKNRIIATLMINRAYALIGVSQAICDNLNNIYTTTKFKCIYNPIENLEENQLNENNEKYILFLGRLDNKVKNILLLLEAYKQSKLRQNVIHLLIMGDGTDKDFIQTIINQMNLSEFVTIQPFNPSIYSVLKNALFLTLTSKNEGFPRVLIEALSVGTPVVSVDCQSGPNEIVQNEKNGLLVENNNLEALTHAFNRMIEEEDLYKTCRANAIESVKHLHKDIIANQWLKLLQKI